MISESHYQRKTNRKRACLGAQFTQIDTSSSCLYKIMWQQHLRATTW